MPSRVLPDEEKRGMTPRGTANSLPDLLPMAEPRAQKTTKSKPSKRAEAGTEPALYDGILARSSAHILEASRKGRDIAPAPEIVDRQRRDAAAASLLAFLSGYFPGTFSLERSDDHLRVI